MKNLKILILLLSVCLVSCEDSLWGIPLETWKQARGSGNFSFLWNLNLKSQNIEDLKILGPGAFYTLGSLFENQNIPESARILWEGSLKYDPVPYSLWAYRDLAQVNLKSRNYESLEAISRQARFIFPEDPEIWRDFMEALYWQKKDRDFLTHLDAGLGMKLTPEKNREMVLFKAVVHSRLGMVEAPMLWKQFLELESSRLHYRAYTFFEEDQKRYQILSELEGQKMVLKALVSEKKGQEVWKRFPKIHDQDELWKSLADFFDWEKFFIQAGQIPLGIKTFEKHLYNSLGEHKSTLEFLLYRLNLQVGRKGAAESWLLKSLNSATGDREVSRSLTALLNFYLQKSPVQFIEILEKYASEKTLAALDGLLDSAKAQFVRTRRWDLLVRGWKKVAYFASDTTKASWAWVILRGGDYGLLPSSETLTQASDFKIRILQWAPLSYSAFMVRAMNGVRWSPPSNPVSTTPEENPGVFAPYQDLLDYGLAYKAYLKLWNGNDLVPVGILKKTAVRLHEQGYYLESQRLMIRAAARDPGALSTEDWKYRYPLAFDDLIRKSAAQAKVAADLFRGLVREESFYDHKISSPVGAVGLSQLMPATGESMKKILRLDPLASLTDPEVNLQIGSAYFSQRMKDLGSPAKALMAYNAGQGRVRSWIREFGQLPVELFVEACPFEETRNYVKKIFSTVSIYQGLYSPEEKETALSLIYPGLR